MGTIASGATTRVDLRRPALAAAVGVTAFAAAMVSGEVFDLNAGSADRGTLTSQIGLYAAIVLVAVVGAVWLGARALSSHPRRLAATAMGLALASLVTVLGFWSGWPHVFAAVAAFLALEHRRRVGSFAAAAVAALLVAVVAFVAASYLCVFG